MDSSDPRQPSIVPGGFPRLTCQPESGVEARSSKGVGLIEQTLGRNLKGQG